MNNTYDIAGMVQEYYKTAGITPEPELSAKLIIGDYNALEGEQGEFEEWSDEYFLWSGGMIGEEYKPENELKELADLTYVIYGYAQSRGWDLNSAVYRVHLNNLARQRQDDGTILRNGMGKILKNPNTPKVDLTDLVQEGDNL